MTSLAFFVGLLPLVVATGAGAIGNRTVGTAAAAGMLMGTIWGVVLVPGLYVLFAAVAAKLSSRHPAAPGPAANDAVSDLGTAGGQVGA
jgi:HAE1 family hydrophobic/amphiphilic exporter-1